MGEAWIIAPPRCPEHGQMREEFSRDTWTCAGWDGEGCEYEVRAQDLAWTHIGQVREIQFTWDRP